MYYYSNNYSKYIENLKLEKSKIAFQKLVEDSKEDKNPDIRIKEVPLSKESGSVTKELDIPSKDGKSFSYEGISSEKSGNKIDTENLRASEKSGNRINPENEISGKSSEQIKDVSSFSNIEPNEVEYDIDYSLKNGSEINGENKLSSKGDSDISAESEFINKNGNEIGVERETVSKSELDMFAENPLSSKNGADLEKQNELSSKNGRDLSGENVPSSKSAIDIIRSIKEEKKREGKFADVIDDQKKKNNFVLEKSYQYFLMDPKDWEAIEYKKNAEKHKYYPADSYSQINAAQKGAIEDITSVFGGSNNWSGAGAAIVSTLKIATDLTDTIWPSVNIYKEGKTANKLRWDLRLQGENNAEVETGKKSEEEKIHGKSHANDSRINYFTDGEDLSEKEKNNIPYETYKDHNNSGDIHVYYLGYSYKQYIGSKTDGSSPYKLVKGIKSFISNDSRRNYIDSLNKDKNNADVKTNPYDLDYFSESEANEYSTFLEYENIELISDGEDGSKYGISVDHDREINKKDISGRIKGQHPGNYEQTGDTIITKDLVDKKQSKNEPILIHDGPANESGKLDTDFFEDSDLTNKDSKENKKDISGKVEIITNGQHPGNYEQTGDTQYHRIVDVEDFAEIKSERNSGVNDKEFNFSYKNKKNINNIAVESESIGEETRWYDTDKNLKAIGRIYVTPPDYELNKNSNAENSGEPNVNGNKAFSIPLQNNLTFEQISRAATWNAIQFFGRIGDVQQYSKTGNLEAINITTKYFVESEDGKDAFTMAKLQDIEMMYRSLVLPASDSAKYLYQEDTDTNSYYYFTRPPLLNIVLGNPGSQTNEIGTNYGKSEIISNGKNPYFNLFTDIYTVPKTNIDEEGENNFENSIYYKNFVATNVTIDKNLNDYNYYVRDKKYFDTTGFTVTLTLLEIDENYLGSLPSFNNYNYTLRSRGAI